jgi:ATP-dependent DNA helicase RecG
VHAFASTEPLEPAPAGRPSPSVLEEPLEVKPARAAKAAEALGLDTVGDLIEHFPREHTDRREARPIASLAGDEDVTVIAEVRRISSRRARGRLTIQTATVVDESGPMKAVWFNQPWLGDSR